MRSDKPRQALEIGEWVTAVRFSPRGDAVVTADMAQGVKIWNSENGQAVATLGPPTTLDTRFRGLEYAADGTCLAAVQLDGTLHVWDASTGAKLKEIPTGFKLARDLKALRGGEIVCIAWDDRFEFYDWKKGRSVKSYPAEVGGGAAVRFSDNSRWMIGLTERWEYGALHLYELHDNRRSNAILFDKAPTALAIKPNSRTIAIGMPDGAIRLLDPLTEQTSAEFSGHIEAVRALEFTADGKHLVSASEDSTLLVWTVPGD
jgi:WD40 repeat protein